MKYFILTLISQLSFFCNGQTKNNEILSDYDIFRWRKAYDTYQTSFIDSLNYRIHPRDTLALSAPIIESRTQLDYETDKENLDDIKLADSLIRIGLINLLSSVVNLQHIEDKNVSMRLSPAIQKALRSFKKDKYTSYRLDTSIQIPSTRFALIPHIKWVKTIPHFDPKKARNQGFARTNFSSSYTWTKCHVSIFIIDLSDMKIIYYKYEWWWTPTAIISPSSRILNKVLKRCLKPFITEMEKNKKLENIHSGTSLGKR